ncbi:aldehyde dehydrogenase [Asanoa ishikariensis]|uniref:Betaine-aldehyde dehydrogenase n=1 Tax=Asanoa ishikariensis TaxID=137265 RepID=A0A1H3TNQ4_9ACTN|nr:aldehyde dehydrogenase family protein [Asanoa ishikariensis]GIF62151.1 aldehyde dehydrogenase [Asanoa ishikariensis]SDZ51265.1 betaine-aldehyde dehydrogenase [Asanoa ishikariensis]
MSTVRTALHWINGKWVDSAQHGESVNPATGEVVGRYADAGRHEAEEAVRAATAAFRESRWADDMEFRTNVLLEIAASFQRHERDLADLTTLENGKTIGEAEFEVSFAKGNFTTAAALAQTTYGRVMEVEPGKHTMVVREPVGVAAVITPWNSPTALLARDLAPALAAGCTAVVKLPGQTPLLNEAISRVFADVPSLPTGVVNIITESGSEAAKWLVDSPDVPVIMFTGSTPTGRAIGASAAKHVKRVGLELGGKTPHIVFDDADLDLALAVIEKSLTIFTGQFCITASRLIVQRGVYETVKQRLAERLANVTVGPGSDRSVDMGALIDKASVARVDRLVEEAIAGGAVPVVRGGPVRDGDLANGAFYRPTLLEVTDSSLPIVQQEVFGPVQTIQVFDTEAEAVALANDSEFGLGASVWSNDVNRPLRVARKVQAGMLWINDWGQLPNQFEIGGYKQSGVGHANGPGGIDHFLEYKTITQKFA